MRILNITNQVPYPPMSGARLRTYNIPRRFARDYEGCLAAFTAREEQREGLAKLLEFCRAVVTTRLRSLEEVMHFAEVVASMLHGELPELRLASSEELARVIQRLR